MIDFDFIRPGGSLDKFAELVDKQVSAHSEIHKMDGLYGGYIIETKYGGKNIRINTRKGIRGMNIPVKVEVVDGTWKAYLNDREIEIMNVIEYDIIYPKGDGSK